jgi:hypothetical protein
MLFVILIGFLFGIFIFLPINELTSYYEFMGDSGVSAGQFVKTQLWKSLTLETPVKFFFYLIFGGIIGVISGILLRLFGKRNRLIDQLQREMDMGLAYLIARGEDDDLEFKSSFRFDYHTQKVNKALESVIIKAITGFMNARGGSLLIGVADDGTVLGLEPDYNTLGRKDGDGFTQLLMSTIASRIGTPACKLVKILFYKQTGKEVCRVIVLPSPIPVYAKEENQSRFYVRTGSGTREMDVPEAVTFIKAKWG